MIYLYLDEFIILINCSTTKDPLVSLGCYLANITIYYLALPLLIYMIGLFSCVYPTVL